MGGLKKPDKNNMSKLNRAIGFFDCRIYKKGTTRQERKMSPEGARINLSIGFEENELTDEIREFAKLHEKSGKWFASFKIFPKNCKAYNASGKETAFPPNSKIDSASFEVNVDFSVKHGDTTQMELNGLYVNKIQFIKKNDSTFEPVADGDDSIFDQNAQAVPIPAPIDEPKSDLPF